MNIKKEMLEYQMIEYIKEFLKNISAENIDHFDIHISNHNGNLQINNTFKSKKKAY